MSCECKRAEAGNGGYVYYPDAGGRRIDHTTMLGAVMAGETSPTIRRKSKAVPGFVADHEVQINSIDFPVVGSVGELEAALNYIAAIGRNDPTAYADSSGTATITSGVLGLGVAIKWSLTADQASAFDVTFTTSGFVTADYVPEEEAVIDADRVMTLRIPGSCAGGTIYVPFAYDRSGSVPEGRIKAGRAQQDLTAHAADGEPNFKAATATVVSTGVPAGLTSFGFSVKLLSAHDPDLYNYLRLLGYVK